MSFGQIFKRCRSCKHNKFYLSSKFPLTYKCSKCHKEHFFISCSRCSSSSDLEKLPNKGLTPGIRVKCHSCQNLFNRIINVIIDNSTESVTPVDSSIKQSCPRCGNPIYYMGLGLPSSIECSNPQCEFFKGN